jgi:hypothetical protein
MPDVSLLSLDTLAWLTNILVVAGTVGVLVLLWSPVLRQSRYWRATVTPLASIIGSGFLVVAPLLGYTVGHWAFFAMLGIVTLAYAVGAAVRYNIRHVEKISDSEHTSGVSDVLLKWLERLAKIVLALAYVIAVTFYLELLAAFVLELFDLKAQTTQKAIATALVVFIGIFGAWRGLEKLETLERFAVDTKLAIIAGFLVGLAVVNVHEFASGSWTLARLDVEWNVETVRKLLGAFLIVQGFETSRYMGHVYSTDERVATMRSAQLLAAAIYLVFIGLASILLGSFRSISETGIITLSTQVAVIAPFLLVIGAANAQFSAAVADTLASGGLVESATYGRINHRYVYLAVMVLAIALLWTSHIFSIIAYASRAFAAYYAIQCAMAALHSALAGPGKSIARAVLFSMLSMIMVLTAIFGIPAETIGS